MLYDFLWCGKKPSRCTLMDKNKFSRWQLYTYYIWLLYFVIFWQKAASAKASTSLNAIHICKRINSKSMLNFKYLIMCVNQTIVSTISTNTNLISRKKIQNKVTWRISAHKWKKFSKSVILNVHKIKQRDSATSKSLYYWNILLHKAANNFKYGTKTCKLLHM